MNPDYQTGSMREQAKDVSGKLSEQVRETSEDVTGRAKETAKTAVSNQKGRVTESVGAIADALHQTADHLDDQDQGSIARFAHMAADRLEDFSNDLQDKSVDQIFGEVEGFARREPALFLGGALALGLLASRFLKSSASRAQQGYGYGPQGRRFGQGSYGQSYSTGYNSGATSSRPYTQRDLADYRRETLDNEYSGQSGLSGYGSGQSGMHGSGTRSTGTGTSGASTLGPETSTGPTSTTSPGTGSTTGSMGLGSNMPPSTKPGDQKPGTKPTQGTDE
jgi:hypothetical protein